MHAFFQSLQLPIETFVRPRLYFRQTPQVVRVRSDNAKRYPVAPICATNLKQRPGEPWLHHSADRDELLRPATSERRRHAVGYQRWLAHAPHDSRQWLLKSSFLVHIRVVLRSTLQTQLQHHFLPSRIALEISKAVVARRKDCRV